jgi:hypothetical protein
MVYLNALRSPEEWKRFEAASRNGHRDGIDKELAEKVAAQARLTVEWPKDLPEAVRSSLAERRTADGWKWDATWSIRDVLRVLIPEEMDFILEPGRLRVVTRDAAQTFWRAWLR